MSSSIVAIALVSLAQPPMAITNVRVIDGLGGAPVENATIVVRGGRIVEVGQGVRVPPGARVIPGRGLSVLPGLADMHTHLSGGWDGETSDYLGYRRMLGSLLYSGVTTVLDPANVTSWVKQLETEIRAGRVAGPRIYYTGLLIDGPTPYWPDISIALSSRAQLPHFLDVLKGAGSSFIKAYFGLADSMVKAVADSARVRGLRVIADVGPRNGSLATAQTGIAAFAHASNRPLTDETVRYLAANGVAVISTLAVYESFARRRFKDLGFLDQPLLKDVLPPSYRSQLLEFGTGARTSPDTAMARRLAEGFPVAMRNVKSLVDAGVLLVAGTDAPYPGDFYGEGLQRELELLVESGLTPLQAIAAATANAAKFVGPNADWGTIAPGKVADLLLVRGNPASKISDTRNIVSVVQAGRVIDRTSLRYNPRLEPDFHPSPLKNR